MLKINKETLTYRLISTIRKDKGAIIGLILLLGILILILGAPLFAPNDPLFVDPTNRIVSPTLEDGYLFGGDQIGRCIFSRVLWGGRNTLLIALYPIAFSLILGVPLGMLCGYYGGKIDDLIMRAFDIVLSFPAVLIAMAITVTLGPGMENAIFAITVISIPIMARLARSRTLEIKEEDFIMAATALGSKTSRIFIKHIFPNIMAPIIVNATLEAGRFVIVAAGLSFLGLGIQPPTPDWGSMLAQGRNLIMNAPHVTLFPGLFIFMFCLGLNLIGDALRDALDPRVGNN